MAAKTAMHYGPTGSGKTAVMGEYAKRCYERWGKISRYVSVAGGGSSDTIRDLIISPDNPDGIIEQWEVPPGLVTHFYGHIMALARGRWPSLRTAKDGKQVITFDWPSAATWERVGCYLWDSLSALSEADFNSHLAEGTKIGPQDPVVQFSQETMNEDGTMTEEKFAYPSKGHYAGIHSQITQFVRLACSIPVEYHAFTALEARQTEDITERTIIAPDMPGRKLGGSAPSWFGNCFRHYVWTHNVADPSDPAKTKLQQDWLAFYAPHKDGDTGLPAVAKIRCRPEDYKAFAAQAANGQPFINLTGNPSALQDFLDKEDQFLKKAMADGRAWKAEIDAKRAGAKGAK